VLLITPFFSPNKGGVETHLDDLVAVLREQGLRTYVLTYQPLNLDERSKAQEDDGIIQVRRVPWLQGGTYNRLEKHRLIQLLFTTTGLLLFSTYYMIRHRKVIHLIHAQGLYATVVGSILKILFHRKLLVSLHMIYGLGRLHPLVLRTLALADRILVLSDRLLSDLACSGLSRVVKFRYWVNQEVFRPANKMQCRNVLGLPARFTVASVGRLVADKGVLPLLEVASRVPDVTFLFVGSGPLATRVCQASIGNKNIIWLGEVDNRKLPVVYGAADLVWAAIDEDYIGRVAMEALSCARPVIALEEMTIDRTTRYVRKNLFNSPLIHLVPNNPELIRNAIVRLSRCLPDMEQVDITAWSSISRTFSKENSRAILESYRQLIG